MILILLFLFFFFLLKIDTFKSVHENFFELSKLIWERDIILYILQYGEKR